MHEDDIDFLELIECDHPHVVDINANTTGYSIFMCVRCGEIVADTSADEDYGLQDFQV